jgi:hypothetical protein
MSTYYLDYTLGNDTTGDGSYALPWKTLSKGHTSASAGDTLVFKDGTHSITGSQVFTKELTIEAENDGLAILDWANNAYSWTNDTATSTGCTVNGLVFYRMTGPAGGHSIIMYGSTFNNCEFRNCRIPNSSDNQGYVGFIGGYRSSDTTRDIVLNNCLFNDVRPYSGTGNVVSNLVSWRGGTGLTGLSEVRFNNCTFYVKTLETGITSFRLFNQYVSAGTKATYKNCIWYDALGITKGDIAGTTFTYGCEYNWGTPLAGTGNITSDPLFVDKDNSNFNLRPTSPCIDTGTLV